MEARLMSETVADGSPDHNLPLTPTQQTQLSRASVHDLAIITNTTADRHKLVYITDVHYHHPGVNPPRVTVLVVPGDSPEHFVNYIHLGWYFEGLALRQDDRTYRDIGSLLSPDSEIILRPSTEQIRTLFYAAVCGHADCLAGLVRLTPQTARDMNIEPEPSRLSELSYTLCPRCMGRAAFEDHEALVRRRLTPQPGDEGLETIHMQAINARRVQLGYSALSEEVSARLPHLAPYFPPPQPSILRVSWAQTRCLCWYEANENYELEQCGICLGFYQDDEGDGEVLVTELCCGHIYHKDCIEPWARRIHNGLEIRGTCPLRCEGVSLV